MADLNVTIQGGVRAAFKAIESLCKTVQYYSLTGTKVRDIEEGTLVPGTNQYTVKQVALLRFAQKELDTYPGVLPTNMKAIFPAENLPAYPQTDDYFIVPSGKFKGKWIVVQNLGEPSETLGKIEVRKS